jgi:hypothetical protein
MMARPAPSRAKRWPVPVVAAIAADVGAPADDPHAHAPARFTLESTALAHRSAGPRRAIEAAFDLLERGWAARASSTEATP